MSISIMLSDYTRRRDELIEERKHTTDKEKLKIIDEKIKRKQFVIDYLLGKNDGKCDYID